MSLVDQHWSPTSAQVTVLQARGLRTKGKSGTNDAYAVMQVGKEKFQTSVVEKSVVPVWKEEATFDLPPTLHQGAGGGGGGGGGTLHVQVLHRALVGPDKLLGQASINLLQLSEDNTRKKTEWFKLLDKTGKHDKDRGEVLVDIQFLRNNMTSSMFDLSAAGKSRSRLGKFKDKVRGKKKESDALTNAAPTFSQVLTDSEEEALGDVEVPVGKDEKKKVLRVKSLFSPKSNLQKNMSQSMSVLPAKNSSLSGSQSYGLNSEASDGKKKFKFSFHKRSGSDNKDASFPQKHVASEQSNLCINGSHIYCEEPQPRTSRIGSNYSISSSGHGSMEDVPDSSPPSVDSLRAVRQYSPWTEEEEEGANVGGNTKGEESELGEHKEETLKIEEERRRKEVKEQERLAEERVRREEEERIKREEEENRVTRQEEEIKRLAEEKRRKEEDRRRNEEAKLIKEEEERQRQEEEERVKREEEEHERLAEEKRRLKEEELKKKEEQQKREEEERKRLEEERVQKERREREEEERQKREEEERISLEEERIQKERRREEEERQKRKEEEERIRLEKERTQEERRRREEEERIRLEEERVQKERREREEEERQKREEEERIRLEEKRAREERRREEEERQKREEEERREEEEERAQEEKRREEEEERIRLEEDRAQKERRRREEEEKQKREEEEKIRLEEERAQEERRRREEEERQKREEEERIRLEEERAQKERRREEEERQKREEEERTRRLEEEQKLGEEKRKLEEEDRRRIEEEKAREELRIKIEEERRKEEEEIMRRQEEKRRIEEQERKQREEEERIRNEEEVKRLKEEYERLLDEKKKLEEEERKRTEEEERKRLEEECRRIEEEKRWQREEEERVKREKEEYERQKEEERKRIEKEEKESKEEQKRIEEEERKKEEEERVRKEKEQIKKEKEEEEARKLEEEKREEEEQKKREYKTKKAAGRRVEFAIPEEVTSTNPFDENYSLNPFEEISCSPSEPDRCTSSTSTNEKDLGGSQREKRAAPQPPGRPPADRHAQKEQDASATRHVAQINKQSKDKDAKQSSLIPKRSVKKMAPVKAPAPGVNNTQTATQNSSTKGTVSIVKPGKRIAPPRPVSSEIKPPQASGGNISEAEQEPIGHSLNPFEDDEDENEPTAEGDTTISSKSDPIQWPQHVSEAADGGTASQNKIKSSKIVRAPLVPAATTATPSTLIDRGAEGGLVADKREVSNSTKAQEPKSEAKNTVIVKETAPQESQHATVKSAKEDAGGKKEGPPAVPRRLQPVKPLNALEQQSNSVANAAKETSSEIRCEVQEQTKVNDTALKGPYSQLTQQELITMVLKQETLLTERDEKISQLEQYIDNLLVRVIEEAPTILMSINSLKKTV